MTKTVTVEAAIDAVLSHQFDPETRICKDMQVGDVVHQGDIYIHCVEPSHKKGKEIGSRKLAIGQGEGSNHMAEGDGVTVYAGVELPPWVTSWCEQNRIPEEVRRQALGPVVVAKKRWSNTHTTHAHHSLPEKTFQVTYQIDLRTQQRVQD